MDYLMIWSVLAAVGALSSAMVLVAAWCFFWEGGGVSEGKPPVANDTESLARVVLRAANRTQVKGSSVRLAVPRAPEVAHEVGVELTEAPLLAVERYLQHHGYVELVEMGLSWGTYTITPAGFEWLDGGATPEEPHSSSAKYPVRELAERSGEGAALLREMGSQAEGSPTHDVLPREAAENLSLDLGAPEYEAALNHLLALGDIEPNRDPALAEQGLYRLTRQGHARVRELHRR